MSFRDSPGTWIPGFTDHPADPDVEAKLELTADHRALPEELGPGRGWFMSSLNEPDDIFMYMRSQITGLTPDMEYEISFSLTFASEAGAGCFGIGGAPGENVYVNAGASPEEPVRELSEMEGPYYFLSVDKGDGANEGDAALVLGDIGVDVPCEGDVPFREKTVDSGDRTLTAVSDSEGRLWLFFGTDSGFEGRTRIYFLEFRAHLRRI